MTGVVRAGCSKDRYALCDAYIYALFEKKKKKKREQKARKGFSLFSMKKEEGGSVEF